MKLWLLTIPSWLGTNWPSWCAATKVVGGRGAYGGELGNELARVVLMSFGCANLRCRRESGCKFAPCRLTQLDSHIQESETAMATADFRLFLASSLIVRATGRVGFVQLNVGRLHHGVPD